jgi:hypothetical protein
MAFVRLERCCIKRFLFSALGAAFAISAMYLPFHLRHVLSTQRHLSSLPCFSLCSILLGSRPSRIVSLTFASPLPQDLAHHFLKLSRPRRKLAASEPHRRPCGPRLLCARERRLKSPNRPTWTSPAWIVLAYYCLAHSSCPAESPRQIMLWDQRQEAHVSGLRSSRAQEAKGLRRTL